MKETFGLAMASPLEYLKEYVAVVRGALWEGKIEHHGRFLNISYNSGRTAHMPILVSALGPKAFEVAGEISDGAISWICPAPYLLGKAIPALRKGAAAMHRPTPPIVANVLVALSEDRDGAREAARGRVQWYSKAPFYTNMFAQAGNPLGPDGRVPDGLLEGLLVSGDMTAIETRLRVLLASGLDKLLVALVPVRDEGSEWGQLLDLIGSL
jgi:alkanesulfonate monooxygenase SsuD/methylene tetrahydromethanopterin reductase-like flavin-dependent oxidoreductase (luciferase family)